MGLMATSFKAINPFHTELLNKSDDAFTPEKRGSDESMIDGASPVKKVLGKPPRESQGPIRPGDVVREVAELIVNSNIITGMTPSYKVIDFHHPRELAKLFDLTMETEPADEGKLRKICSDVIKYSVRTSHPSYYNQLYGGVDEYGLAATWLTEALNTSQYTYEVAPLFTLIEQKVIEHLLKLFSFPGGDGIFCPGGSMCNMYAMICARYQAHPEMKKKGMFGSVPLVVFTSTESHYSITKSANVMGLGIENIVKIPCDPLGRMVPSELENQILKALEQKKKPFFVNCTAGTTVLGAYDQLRPIAKICRKYNLWMHVDAAWGGSVILSDVLRSRLDGVELADSLTWDPHKMLCAPLQCSVFLIRHKGLLHQCNSASATYLFQQDKFYDVSYDTGDKSIQCGRKIDAFKLWFMWKGRGQQALTDSVDNAFKQAKYLTEKLRYRDDFQLVMPEYQCTNICFWYIPPCLRRQPQNQEWKDRLHKVAPIIKESLVMSGQMMISYQPLPQLSLPNFFRMIVTCQPWSTNEDMDGVLDQIATIGSHIVV